MYFIYILFIIIYYYLLRTMYATALVSETSKATSPTCRATPMLGTIQGGERHVYGYNFPLYYQPDSIEEQRNLG